MMVGTCLRPIGVVCWLRDSGEPGPSRQKWKIGAGARQPDRRFAGILDWVAQGNVGVRL